ncbi:MAG: hypothetical protein M3356_04645, partial [Actinomycetota bacterium]|nr:hypothetical protein [Actinomycetota bacterium]
KELRPFHDHVTCEVCGRTILKGERTEAYLAPGGQRNTVCELCFVRAEHGGWLRESAHGQAPARGPRLQERRPIFGRLRRRPSEASNGMPTQEPEPPDFEGAEGEPTPGNGETPPVPRRERERPQNPRHVRGVPTTAEVKLDRALALFNESAHQRTVAGLARSLGEPWVTAVPDADAPSAVTVIVAWELSWYRFRVDLGDADEPVALQAKGDELGDIEEPLRAWNAGLGAEGQLVIGVASE